jgi:Ran GTPase-activating protein (RanGAP) involved in mRNA processing and transport
MLCEVPIKDKTLTELDVSGLSLGSEGALVVAEYLRDNGAMTSINLANNNIGTIVMSDGWKYDHDTNEYWKNVDGTEQVSKYLPECCGPLGVIAVANAIKDMRALSVANVMGNSIGKEQLAKLQEIMRSKPNLVSLCGIADDATEADLSGHGMDADDAAILASELLDKGALLTLILSKNGIIQREVGTVLAGMLKANTVLTTLDISDCADYTAGPDGAGFAQELAVGIKDNWALTKLDISNNIQQGEALQRIADLCNAKGVELDNHKRESDWDY